MRATNTMAGWLAAALGFMAITAGAAEGCGARCDGHWVAAWGTAQQLMQPARAIPSPQNVPAQVADQTVRMIVRPTVSGTALRLSFSNSFGHAPVRLEAVRVARLAGAAAEGAVAPGAGTVTFAGRPWVVIPPGAQVASDPLAFAVQAQGDLAVSVHVAGASGPTTAHPLGLRSAWLAPGNQVDAVRLRDASPFRSYLWLAGVDVRAASRAAAIVALGDSITDGYSTTPDADLAWPSILARRLGAQRGRPPRAVVNMGISGNRVLREGAGSSALARFDRDVLSRPGVRWVVLMEGINDINFNAIPGLPADEKATAEDIIAGYRMLISRARLHGLKIYGGTLMPCEGINVYGEAGEAMRQQVNRWIRESGEFDAVIDFDAVTRDPARPSRLRAEYDSGDHIHPNDAGNRAMAEAIDLALFR